MDESIDIEYGVSTPPNSYNLYIILMHEYQNIWQDMKKSSNWYHKFMYAFGPPGWSHDGSTLTVKQIRKAMAKEKLEAERKKVEKEKELKVA